MFTSLRCVRFYALKSAALVCAFPLLVAAQNAFSPGGKEYSLIGGPVGDQTSPRLAINPGGGWLVWQDNAADGNGLGVKIQRLNASYERSGNAIKVNSIVAGNQEKPRVSFWSTNNAVVVWQGGAQGFPEIYARFVRSNLTFLTSADVRVNTYTNDFQMDPAVATLKDGSVVVVWSSFGQDGSLQGIYGQRFTAAGAKAGTEFRINQTIINNQRTPDVAALAGGGFVVAWVSELQRAANSVDIYARVFDTVGSPVTDELLLSGDSYRPCANPSLASSRDGGFAVAWSEKDVIPGVSLVATGASSFSALSWDVYVRCFNSTGAATTQPVRMNSMTYGDQYAPRLAGFGRNYLATWLSLGQDGSMEGVYGQFLGEDASLAGVEFRVNTANASRQIDATIASDGINRFLVAWASFGSSMGFDLFARAYDLIRVEITPLSQGVRVSWNSQPGLKYQLQVSTNYVTWSNHGAPVTAAGYTSQADINAAASGAAYRVVRIQ